MKCKLDKCVWLRSPFLCLCVVVNSYLLCALVSGAVYRFDGGNPCNHLDSISTEVNRLTDGDVSSCEATNGATMDVFRLFLGSIPQRNLIMTVIGSHMDCNPVSGLHVAISSTSHQSYTCKLKFSNAPDRCHYKCSCMGDDVWSHVIIGILGVGNRDILWIKNRLTLVNFTFLEAFEHGVIFVWRGHANIPCTENRVNTKHDERIVSWYGCLFGTKSPRPSETFLVRMLFNRPWPIRGKWNDAI